MDQEKATSSPESEERVRRAEAEARVLKLQRAEDAKANEKVVGIFAAHRQGWIAERKRLRARVQSLLADLRAFEARRDEALEEEVRRRRETEEKLVLADEVVEELRERAKKEAEDHSAEIYKHKTAFVELVSNQRQLEADLGRALRQADAVKEEKEEAVGAAEKFRKDAEQKERILSAILRKSKIDASEKQMLLKEVKIAKAKKKQAEMESERWRAMCESNSRSKKGSRHLKAVEAGSSGDRTGEKQLKGSEGRPKTLLLDFLKSESKKEHKSLMAKGENITTVHCLDQYSSNQTNDLDDVQDLQDWVRLEKFVTTVEQRHCTDIEAFMEQLRLKDEKIESFEWQLLGMEHESKRLQSRIEGVNGSLSQLRDENFKLGHELLDKENELKSLKEQLNFYAKLWLSKTKDTSTFDPQALSPELKMMKKLLKEKEQEIEANSVRKGHIVENEIKEMDGQDTNEDKKIVQLASPHTASSSDFSSPANHLNDCSIIYANELSSEHPISTEISTEDKDKSTPTLTRIHNEEIKDEIRVNASPVHGSKQNSFQEMTKIANKPFCLETTFAVKDTSWKMDIHALGVSYKIKRLKQQLLVLEKVSEVQARLVIKDDTTNGSKEKKIDTKYRQNKELPFIISFLDKHAKRYQSLEEKTDDLCSRMHESYRSISSRDTNDYKKREQTEMLESFLGETFQLQRYVVATGQKLLEIQSRITSSFSGGHGLGESAGFNMRQFADIIGNLLKEIQRGLEVRISKVIGDLEGTLTCDGILHSSNHN